MEGYLEPISSDALGQGAYEFDNQLVGNMIPPEFVTAIDKAPLSAAVPSSARHRTTPPPPPSESRGGARLSPSCSAGTQREAGHVVRSIASSLV